MVSITHEQYIICSKTHLDGTTHEQTIIILLAVIGRSRGGLSANERNGKIHQMIIPRAPECLLANLALQEFFQAINFHITQTTKHQPDKCERWQQLLCWCFETVIVCPCLFIAIQLYWNFKLYCFHFFSKICTSKSEERLIHGRLW